MNSRPSRWFAVIVASVLLLSQGNSTEVQIECQTTKSKFCANFDSKLVAIPNYRGGISTMEINHEMDTFLTSYTSGCSNALVHFLCAYYNPVCFNLSNVLSIRIPPCRELCHYVRSSCEPVMNRSGGTWPHHLDCSQFPSTCTTTPCYPGYASLDRYQSLPSLLVPHSFGHPVNITNGTDLGRKAVSIQCMSITATEGQTLQCHLVVTSAFQVDKTVQITAVGDTASSGSDFDLLTTSVTIKAYMMRSDPIRVMIVNDTIVEDEEMFQLGVVLSDELTSCGVELVDPSTVNVTIEDDDPVYVSLNLRRIPRTIREGNGSAVIQLEVENGTVFFPINVTVTVREIGMGPGHALEFLDFYVFGDENLARFNRFDNVSTSAEIRTVDNEICEDDEDFEIQITIDPVKQPRVILVEPTTLRLTIEDDDTENCFPPTVVSFTSDAVRIVERGKKYRLPVHRIGRLENDLTIKVITEELTATEGDDFIIITKRIRFRKTSSSYGQANIQYTVPDKDGVEPREAFRIVLEAPDGVMIRQADVTIIITDEN